MMEYNATQNKYAYSFILMFSSVKNHFIVYPHIHKTFTGTANSFIVTKLNRDNFKYLTCIQFLCSDLPVKKGNLFGVRKTPMINHTWLQNFYKCKPCVYR